ncbi:uncharacterized protein TNCV_347761 [Trichonephila clavipes]|nr:uncharacterized protein TNCV_347761 [Trichonephila clavipes]
MFYHRTILEPHTAYPIPAVTHYIVLTVQKTAFGLDIIPEFLLPHLIQNGFHVGYFRKMKKFDPTPYKLPPPTPIQVPAEKRPLEEKSLPFSKKRSKVHITPVMRRIPHVSEPVQIPHVPEPVQIPVSNVPEPPVQIPHVTQPPVQIPVSQVQQSSVQIPMSQVPQPPMQILQVPEPMQIFPRTYADFPRTYADFLRTYADSPRTYADSPRTYADSPRTYANSPRTYADSPRTRHFGPFGVDARPAHVVRIWTLSPRTPAASHRTLYF